MPLTIYFVPHSLCQLKSMVFIIIVVLSARQESCRSCIVQNKVTDRCMSKLTHLVSLGELTRIFGHVAHI